MASGFIVPQCFLKHRRSIFYSCRSALQLPADGTGGERPRAAAASAVGLAALHRTMASGFIVHNVF